ncbi:RNA-guided endonuclease InsQ/TnpB family protein [Thermosporothrix hazakensis]|nr:transposase [Thermosporothrix hazakensis]GCE46400.1 transposase [Thermosporothrix hazakensis]
MSKEKKQAQLKKTRKQKSLNLRNKAFKFRIYPTEKQIGKLQWTLRRCKELYNAALEERREAYRMAGVSVSYYTQNKQLPEIKEIREEYRDIHSQVLQDVLTRVDKAMDNFFRRVKNGEKPGYPRFKSGDRYDSFTYTQSGFEIMKGKLNLSKIGRVKIKLHREIVGKIKTCTMKREGDQWYVVFTTEYEFDPSMAFHPTTREVGVDLGINSFAALSDGTFIENPRYYRNEEEKIQAAHKKIARRKKGSHRRNRAKKELSRLYRKVRNRRRDFLHKQSRKLVNENAVVVFEDLQVDKMTKRPKPKQDEDGKYLPNGAAAKGGLNKSILDAGWSAFVALCASKAEEAGCTVVKVAPKDTSQVCSSCGCVVKKDLSVRWHSCPHCGCELDRDHNAALNILIRYRKLKGAGSVPQLSPVG